MHLVLSRITTSSDFATFVPIQFRAFHADGGHAALKGVSTPEGPVSPHSIPYTIAMNTKSLEGDTSAVWLKIVDEDANERPVSMALWLIYPNFSPAEWQKHFDDIKIITPESITFYNDPHQRHDSYTMTQKFLTTRHTHTKEAHCLLSVLFTDPAYKGRGAGRMMVEWGTRLADQLMLPCWVEASKEGRPLYAKCGFDVVEHIYLKTEALELPLDYPIMRRPVQVTQLAGRGLEPRDVDPRKVVESAYPRPVVPCDTPNIPS